MPDNGTARISPCTMNRQFNTVVCVDHMNLDDNLVFHIMDSTSRYSVRDVVDTVSMWNAIPLFEALWVSSFWTPKSVLFDPAFEKFGFTNNLKSLGIEARPIPPRRHNKYVLEPKQRTIREVYLGLKAEAQPDCTQAERVLMQRAIKTSNDLNWTDVCSAQELAEGYTRAVKEDSFPENVPTEILEAHDKLIARRKLSIFCGPSLSLRRQCALETQCRFRLRSSSKNVESGLHLRLCCRTKNPQRLSLFQTTMELK